MKYVPLRCHSSFSLLKSINLPESISVRLNQIGVTSCALTDHGNLSGVPSFIKGLVDTCKNCGHTSETHQDGKGKCVVKDSNCNGFEKSVTKPIIGQKFNLLDGSYFHILTKNKIGWQNLIKLSTESHNPETYKSSPKINKESIFNKKDGLIVYSGGSRSELANFIITNKMAYHAKSYDEAKSFIKDKSFLKKELLELVDTYKQNFSENFFLAIELIDKKNSPICEVLSNIFKWVGKELNVKCVGVPDPYYTNKELAADQRILLCNELDTSLDQAVSKINESNEDLLQFFKSNNYYIPSYSNMIEAGHTEEELSNTLLVDEMCEKYDIFGKPQLPNFICPDNKTPDAYLRELCLAGWDKKIKELVKNDSSKKDEYSSRVKEELSTLSSANLASYFLIVQDFNRFARETLLCPKDPGRGSAAGCLVSYLIDITNCDPIKYDLSFSRFYNSARNDPKAGKFAIPDIDMDYPPSAREHIVEYIRKKYGNDKVCHMATFAEFKGKEALTMIFRGHGWGSSSDRKMITSFIAQKDKITDDLQEMIEETGESSIIRWSLENVSGLKEYCEITENGLEGPLAKYFEQAIRLEGVKKNQSKHASGIIISPTSISDVCPMIFDPTSGQLVTAFDMYAAEPTGLIKFDILGTNVNQKIVDACKFAKYGKIV